MTTESKYRRATVYSASMYQVPCRQDSPLPLYMDYIAASDNGNIPLDRIGKAKIIYRDGGMPPMGKTVYRWVFSRDGKYAGATEWYQSTVHAIDERNVITRKGNIDFDDGDTTLQVGIVT